MISKLTIFFCLLFGIFITPCFSQKIKYKELFVLLNAKQYEQAEPFLKKYLKENEDNPNAFLFMGNIYEEKAMANDVLRETEKQGLNTDSAVLYFDRTMKEITDKELRKNEEYYEAYSRRDLRTGKFGIQLSNIQYDLEQRIKALKNRKMIVLSLKEKFVETQRIYGHCIAQFIDIAGRHKGIKEFYLRADESVMSDLRKLARKYDSCILSFNGYKLTLQGIAKTGHNQVLEPQDISNFASDGRGSIDFYNDELKIWDFKRWALSNLEVIENEILPNTESIIKLDAELNVLQEKMKKDSIVLTPELSSVTKKIGALNLQKFDPRPLPIDIFNLKVLELEFGSELAKIRTVRDSAGLSLRLNWYRKHKAILGRMDSVANLLMLRDLEYETENYKSFVTHSYGSSTVLRSMIKSTYDYAVAEKAEKEKRANAIEQTLNWVYDGLDSIPVSAAVVSKKFHPILIASESHTFGLVYADSASFAYFYTITPTRKAAIKAFHKVDSSIFNKIKFSTCKGISIRDVSKDEFYAVMYSEERREDKIPAIIYRINRTDGLVWSNSYMLEGIPSQAAYNKENGSLQLQVSLNGSTKTIVVQADGKQL